MILCICQALLVNVSNICLTEQQGQLIDAGGMQRVEQLIRWYAKSKDERSLKINHKKISVKLQGIECIMFAKIMKQTICPKKITMIQELWMKWTQHGEKLQKQK